MDDLEQEQACLMATAKEREYVTGWRAFVNGLPRSFGYWWEVGYKDAKHAFELGRNVIWSRRILEGEP